MRTPALAGAVLLLTIPLAAQLADPGGGGGKGDSKAGEGILGGAIAAAQEAARQADAQAALRKTRENLTALVSAATVLRGQVPNADKEQDAEYPRGYAARGDALVARGTLLQGRLDGLERLAASLEAAALKREAASIQADSAALADDWWLYSTVASLHELEYYFRAYATHRPAPAKADDGRPLFRWMDAFTDGMTGGGREAAANALVKAVNPDAERFQGSLRESKPALDAAARRIAGGDFPAARKVLEGLPGGSLEALLDGAVAAQRSRVCAEACVETALIDPILGTSGPGMGAVTRSVPVRRAKMAPAQPSPSRVIYRLRQIQASAEPAAGNRK